jgi:hypothetical protein
MTRTSCACPRWSSTSTPTHPASGPKTRTRPDRRPDLDKLVRSTLDALTTAGTIEVDARIAEMFVIGGKREEHVSGLKAIAEQRERRPTQFLGNPPGG